MNDNDFLLGHASSRPLTDGERDDLIRLTQIKARHQAEEERKREEAKYAGYLFWCSEGCGFVSRNHRCEQWTNITYVSPALIKAIKEIP